MLFLDRNKGLRCSEGRFYRNHLQEALRWLAVPPEKGQQRSWSAGKRPRGSLQSRQSRSNSIPLWGKKMQALSNYFLKESNLEWHLAPTPGYIFKKGISKNEISLIVLVETALTFSCRRNEIGCNLYSD